MGSCVSIHRNPEAASKLRFSVGSSKNEELLIPSPVKEKSDKVNGGDHAVSDLALKSRWSSPRFRDAAGSKDEAFFDSQPWLDSDCEEDFLSVNGDFTPSRGSTPVHHKFSSANVSTKSLDMEVTFVSVDEESPPGNKKKRLSDLFKESLRTNQYVIVEENAAKTDVGANSTNGVLKTEEESVKSAQCCLPSLRSSHSFDEKKKKTSPSAER
ncbi:hypothetical protein ABFS83_11G130600 [Erythranthe nasuta]